VPRRPPVGGVAKRSRKPSRWPRERKRVCPSALGPRSVVNQVMVENLAVSGTPYMHKVLGKSMRSRSRLRRNHG
jgi:hypothetical protein